MRASRLAAVFAPFLGCAQPAAPAAPAPPERREITTVTIDPDAHGVAGSADHVFIAADREAAGLVPRYRKCQLAARERTPSVAGEVKLVVTLTSLGEVASIEPRERVGLDDALVECLAAVTVEQRSRPTTPRSSFRCAFALRETESHR